MTSTVLDVSIMLLCVSAGVVALGGVGDDPTATPNAGTVADRLTTETATVEYGSDGDSLTPVDAVPDGKGGTVHATLAELLWLAAFGEADRPADHETFHASVIETVADHLGPRVRVDLRFSSADRGIDLVPGADDARHASDETRGADPIVVGDPPPRSADVATAVVSLPAPNVADERADGSRLIVRTW